MVHTFPCCICSRPGRLRVHPYLPGSNYFCDSDYKFLQDGYDPEIDEPFIYFRSPAERPDTDAPVIGFYEYHGKWCLRRVNQFEDKLYRAARQGAYWAGGDAPLNPALLRSVKVKSINRTDFEEIWDVADEDPCVF